MNKWTHVTLQNGRKYLLTDDKIKSLQHNADGSSTIELINGKTIHVKENALAIHKLFNMNGPQLNNRK